MLNHEKEAIRLEQNVQKLLERIKHMKAQAKHRTDRIKRLESEVARLDYIRKAAKVYLDRDDAAGQMVLIDAMKELNR